MNAPTCAIVIPTFRRNDGLIRAVESVFAQLGIEYVELIIADNDPGGMAKVTAEQLIATAPDFLNVRYIHEPNPGVANARNAALNATEARLIAFLDDDQSAPKTWLANLLRCHANHQATVTFGPVEAVLPATESSHIEYLTNFFSRVAEYDTGLIDEYFGCGNSLIDRDTLPELSPVFDPDTNESGGEDDELFGQVERAGGKFAWCKDAPVYEHVPADRATLPYTLKRAFAYGQGPVTAARRRNPPRWGTVAYWMIIGSGKLGLNGLIYGGKWIVRADDRAEYLDRAVRGLGKVLWWKNLNFYGRSRLN